mmetsp:Transcript_25092/g.51873  ORF Transcript_25092/g.51873 Transcript_25092/m.51873 type:complete len:205 (-) Transcript_25092:327-941(-)
MTRMGHLRKKWGQAPGRNPSNAGIATGITTRVNAPNLRNLKKESTNSTSKKVTMTQTDSRSSRKGMEIYNSICTTFIWTCTNFHSACSDEHLINLRSVKGGGLVSRCNAGTTQTKMKGNYGNLELWYNPSGIANLLSFDKMEKDGYEFTYQTKRTGGRYVCHTPNGDVKFEKCNKLGFHYVDMRSNEAAVCLLNTVGGNYEGYT